MEIQGLRWDKRALPQCGWVRMQRHNLVWLLSTQTYTTCVSSECQHIHHVHIKGSAKWNNCQISVVCPAWHISCNSVFSNRKSAQQRCKLLMTDGYVKRIICCLTEENCVRASQTQHFMQLRSMTALISHPLFHVLTVQCDLFRATLDFEGERVKETKTCTSSCRGWLRPVWAGVLYYCLCTLLILFSLCLHNDHTWCM